MLLACLIMLGASASIRAQEQASKSAGSDYPPPVQLTAQQDHKRMMDLLKITSLRPGPSGNPQAANAANYDEAKANPYPDLPDPLVLKNGKKVTTPEMWWNERRPEIVEDFDREIYGRVPRETPKVNWEVTSTTSEKNGDVPVITKKLVGHVDNSAYPPITVDIQLTLTTPANATGPVPVMMEFGFGGFGRGGFGGFPKAATKGATKGAPRPGGSGFGGFGGGAARRGSSSFWPRAGAMPSSSRAASRPTTARG